MMATKTSKLIIKLLRWSNEFTHQAVNFTGRQFTGSIEVTYIYIALPPSCMYKGFGNENNNNDNNKNLKGDYQNHKRLQWCNVRVPTGWWLSLLLLWLLHRIFSLNLWWEGTQDFSSPPGTRGQSRMGGLAKKIWLKPKLPTKCKIRPFFAILSMKYNFLRYFWA